MIKYSVLQLVLCTFLFIFTETGLKLAICNQCKDYIRQISQHSASQKLIIRGLLEAALSPAYSPMFGASIPPPPPTQQRIYASNGNKVLHLLFSPQYDQFQMIVPFE